MFVKKTYTTVAWESRDEDVKGKAVIARHPVRAIHMGQLATASVLITPDGGISTHAIFIAKQLGIKLVSEKKHILQGGEEVKIGAVLGNSGFGLGTEAGDAELYMKCYNQMIENRIYLDYLVSVSGKTIAPLLGKVEQLPEYLFCTEHIYAIAGFNPFHEKNKILPVLEASLKELQGLGVRVTLRSVDVDPMEYAENVETDKRGIRLLLENPEVLEAETDVASRFGLDLCLSFVRTRDEWARALEIIRGVSADVPVGLMVETPMIIEQLNVLDDLRFAFLGMGDLKTLLFGLARDGWVKLTKQEHTYLQQYVATITSKLKERDIELVAPFSIPLASKGQWKGPSHVYIRDLGDLHSFDFNKSCLFKSPEERLNYVII